mmetsp:Transcript_13962/g.16861  ORF Transcript_13962/g.16861 Transcript_13962/m.16861 type:complete len:263 (-) Transcript_13962:478-1266(-)
MEETTQGEEAQFNKLENPQKWAWTDSFVTSNLQKWGLQEGSQVARFRYTKRYHRLAAEEFLVDFFNSEEVQKHLKVAGDRGEQVSPQSVSAVKCEVLPSDIISLNFFDKLETADPPIVKGEGYICKCMDLQIDGVTISDMLGDLLMNEESENEALYSEQERKQFMFHILRNLVLGGAMCQYDDSIEPYMETIKRIYKSLLCVQKNAATNQIEVTSVVYKVTAVESDNWSLFPKHSPQNFCYVCVDPLRRQCTWWYHYAKSHW